MVNKNDFKNRDIVTIKDFSREELEFIFDLTEKVKKDPEKFRSVLDSKVVSLLFFEPSTRTYNSFLVAADHLGCKVIGFADPNVSSYGGKGETLHDTIKMFEGYSDCIIMRHPLMGSAKFAAETSSKPVINGGSGAEEHPTQAILDLFTMREHFGKLDNLNIGILGDLKFGRTPPPLSYAFSNYDVNLSFIAPEILQIRPEVELFLKQKNVSFEKFIDLADVIDKLDILYVTRIQKERFSDPTEYEKVRGLYKVSLQSIRGAKDSLIIMHPLPRIDEMSPEIDKTKHAKYFEQAENGKFARIALLSLVLGG